MTPRPSPARDRDEVIFAIPLEGETVPADGRFALEVRTRGAGAASLRWPVAP
jgi:hypothetical protein